MYIDVLHNRADNYQDRMEIVARSGNDPSDLGEYRENLVLLPSTAVQSLVETQV